MRIIDVVKKIPRGKVASYAAVARAARTSPRAVGFVMRANRDPAVPCHRVVCSSGMPGGFNRGLEQKIALLKAEGIRIVKGRIGKKYLIA